MTRRACAVAAGVANLWGAATYGSPSSVEALERCVAIDAAELRLACYDAVAGRTDASGTPVHAAPAKDPATLERNFGLSAEQLRPVAPQGPDAIHAKIAGLTTDRVGHAIVSLDNGQIWFVSEDASRLAIGAEVTIRKAALGSFMMSTADHHAYTVRRTR